MIKCVAIDDEPIALSILREYCGRYGGLELKCFTSPVAGMACIAAERPQIVLLDIEMNSHNGLELARRLPAGTCLVFTTAFANYALDGFDVDAVDFLHKPIFYARFCQAMEKAKRYLRPDGGGEAKPADGAGEEPRGSLTLKASHKNVVVAFSDIILVEAMDNYVKVYRKGQPMVIPQMPLKEIGRMLPADWFVRIHRSYIIGLRYVERYSNRTVYLKDHAQGVPVGRKYMEAFREAMLLKKSQLGNHSE